METQDFSVDQMVDARVAQRLSLTFGGVMIDKIRAEEEVVILRSKVAERDQRIAELQKEIEQLMPKPLPEMSPMHTDGSKTKNNGVMAL